MPSSTPCPPPAEATQEAGLTSAQILTNSQTKGTVQKGESSLYLDADGEQKARLCEEGEGLVVGHVLPVGPHRVIQGGVRDEEEHQRAVAAVEGALEEGRLAEVQVELARDVELWMLEAPHVVHILTSRGRQRHALEQKLDEKRGRIKAFIDCR